MNSSQLAVVGAVIAAAVAACIVVVVWTDAPDSRPEEEVGSDAAAAMRALVAPNDLAAATDEVICSRVEDIGEQLLERRERDEFEQLSDHLSGLTVELAADLAGLQPYLRYGDLFPLAAHFGMRLGPSYPLPELVAHSLPRSAEDALGRLIEAGEFAAVFDHPALQGARDATLDVADSAGDHRTTTVLGALLRHHGASADQWLPQMPDDWPIGIHDLAVAVVAGVPAAVFESLLDRGGGADTHWPDRFGGEVDLAQLAAYHMQPKLLQALVDRGLDLAARKQPLIDDIARQPEASEHEATVVAMLVAAGLKVRRPTTLDVLRDRHPQQAGLQLHPDVEAALDSPETTNLARSLAGARERWQTARQRLESWREQCRARQAADLLTLTAKRRHDSEKRRHDGDLHEALGRELREGVVALEGLLGTAGQRDDQLGDLVGRLWESAFERRWSDAIAAAEDVPEPMRKFTSRDLLSQALRVGAPMEVFEALLELNDGVLPADAILDLASRGWEGSAGVAEALLARGLDVHHVDRFGENAFSRVASLYVTGYAPFEGMASFLASQGVSPKPSPLGMDPLDKVLSDMMLNVEDSGLWLAQLLVDIGAPIEASHRELAQRIALLDPDGHARLVHSIPALGSSGDGTQSFR